MNDTLTYNPSSLSHNLIIPYPCGVLLALGVVSDELDAVDGLVHLGAVVPGVQAAAERLLQGASRRAQLAGAAAAVHHGRGRRAVDATR